MRKDMRVFSDHVRHNAAQSVSTSSYAGDGVCRICDSWGDGVHSNRLSSG
jgi:hypothetical protein